MMKLIPILYILLLSGIVHAQPWETISGEAFLEAMIRCNAGTNKENSSIEFKRQVFTHAGDAQPYHTSTGRLTRGKGCEYRLETEQQLLIQTGDVKMVIDSSESLILLLKPDSLFEQTDPSRWFSRQEAVSASYFALSTGNTRQYKIVFAAGTSMYKHFILSVDSRTSELRKAEFTLSPANYFSNDPEDTTPEEPRIVLTYQRPAAGAGKNQFDLSHWLRRKGDQYELQPQITYTLDDLRITH